MTTDEGELLVEPRRAFGGRFEAVFGVGMGEGVVTSTKVFSLSSSSSSEKTNKFCGTDGPSGKTEKNPPSNMFKVAIQEPNSTSCHVRKQNFSR